MIEAAAQRRPTKRPIFSQAQFSAIWRNLPRWFLSPVLSGLSELALEINDLRMIANSREIAQKAHNPSRRKAVRRTLCPPSTNLHFKEQDA
jgi:hypothetical protein